MHPDIHIFGQSLPSYFTMFLLSYIVSVIAAVLRIRTQRMNWKTAGLFIVISVLCGMVGARVLFILYHLDMFAQNPGLLKGVILSGFAFYGALYGALGGGYAYSRIAKKDFLYLADNLLFVMPLGHAIRKVGCFLGGCCYGKCTGNALFEALGGRHPVQLYEAGANLLIFAVLAVLLVRRARRGTVLAAYLISYGAARFVTDFYRSDVIEVFYGLGVSHFISMATFIFGVILLIRIYQNGGKANEQVV